MGRSSRETKRIVKYTGKEDRAEVGVCEEETAGEEAKSGCLRKQRTPLLTGPTLSATITYFCIYVLYGIWNTSLF